MHKRTDMRPSRRVRSISYVEVHAADIVGELAEGGQLVVITVNGEVKAILQDLGEHERQREAMARSRGCRAMTGEGPAHRGRSIGS